MLAKDDATGGATREWFILIDSSEKVKLYISDNSASKACSRLSDSGLSVGWHFVGTTYDGSGGDVAANGIIMYSEGALIASTATNVAGYVAMENSTSAVAIGAQINNPAVPANFFKDKIGMGFVVNRVLTAAEWLSLYNATKKYYGQ